jgi:hypothetical protein
MSVRGQRILCLIVIKLALTRPWHFDFSKSVMVVLRMLVAHGGICKIKDADAQMFVGQLE